MSRKPKVRSYILYIANNKDDDGTRGTDNKKELVLLDSLNTKIIKDLVSNPNVRSATIASNTKLPYPPYREEKRNLKTQ